MKNTIATRIADFLKDYPPFSLLQKEILIKIAKNAVVIYKDKNELVFEQNDNAHSNFYIVNKGAIALYQQNSDTLVDLCDEGDIFGLRALIGKDNYKLKAIANEETILYGIPITILEKNLITNIEVSNYLLNTFANNTRVSINQNTSAPSFNTSSIPQSQTIDFNKNCVTCTSKTSIKETAKLMFTHKIGSLIIVENKLPIGIVTDKDFRREIALGKLELSNSVTTIMSSPVITAKPQISIAEAQIQMLKNNIRHLCITENGTDKSNILGIISEHDIVVNKGNNPEVLLKKVFRANTLEELLFFKERIYKLLGNYIQQRIPIDFTQKIINELIKGLTTKIINLSIDEIGQQPPVEFSWLSIGSQGRGEQLLFTDQDNALVFANVSKEDYKSTKAYFIKLATLVTKKLNKIGFEYCPANMMASNPNYCLSLQEWQDLFYKWVNSPTENNLLNSTIFFDYSPINDSKLSQKLTSFLFKTLSQGKDLFFLYLSRNSLQNPPPLGFFRQFLVENTGEHQNQFDIKARALMPLIDAARILALAHQITETNNTKERFKVLMQKEPQNASIYEACSIAFDTLIQFRLQQGMLHKDSGRFINLKELSKIERLKLKTSFKTINEVQQLLATRYKLAQFM